MPTSLYSVLLCAVNSPELSTMSLSMPRGPSVVRMASTIAWQAFMLLTSCGLPCEVSVPSFSRMIGACYTVTDHKHNIKQINNSDNHPSRKPKKQFWRQRLCSCGPHTMEQSSISPERGGLTIQSISAVAKDIFVLIVGHGAV